MNANLQRTRRFSIVGLIVAILAVGCRSTGVGEGATPEGDIGVTFLWEQKSPIEGELRAQLVQAGGIAETYTGRFFQITRESRLETLGPLWSAWNPNWIGWRYWGPEPQLTFVTHYTGEVVANLEGPDGQRMRCHFVLLKASSGMKGGGKGECQLASGLTIRTEFPPV
jgi:hypothetical protein